MISGDAIGSVALGELGGEPDVIVYASPFSVAVSLGNAPVVRGGASVLPSAASAVVTAARPSVRAGVMMIIPGVAIVVAPGTTDIAISATVTVQSSSVGAAGIVPAIAAGVMVRAPSTAEAVAAPKPFVTAGKSALPSAAMVAVQPKAPGISISSTSHPATIPITVTVRAPDILGGNYIEAVNTVTMITPYGEIGSASIGQFAIGEGEPSTRVAKIPPIVIISLKPPFVTAGKSIWPASAAIATSLPRPEVHARRRKLRIIVSAN